VLPLAGYRVWRPVNNGAFVPCRFYPAGSW